MSQSRLTLAVDSEQIAWPSEGRIAVFAPVAGMDLSSLPKERCVIIQTVKTHYDAFEAAGWSCAIAPEGDFAASVVCLTRAKAQARGFIAQAVALGGQVVVDGQKTDGAESFLKDCRKRADVTAVLSKSHGKLFAFSGGDFSDWAIGDPTEVAPGLITVPGVFSADGIDPASAALVAALPEKLGKQVADLGAGWGYLSKAILERDTVETLYAVEADHAALTCAKANVSDDRAEFFWADATTWQPRAKMNTVVMNPPFHTGRKAEPDLGRAFISAAAKMLAPTGHLWLVANRHLPYEPHLEACFAKVQEVAGDNRFKILHAERPSRK